MEISIISHRGKYEQCWAGRRVVAGRCRPTELLLEGTCRYNGRIREQRLLGGSGCIRYECGGCLGRYINNGRHSCEGSMKNIDFIRLSCLLIVIFWATEDEIVTGGTKAGHYEQSRPHASTAI